MGIGNGKEHSNYFDVPEWNKRVTNKYPEELTNQLLIDVADQIYERHGNEELALIGILMGADTALVHISEQLARRGNLRVLKGYLSISSYGDGQESSKNAKVDAVIIKFDPKKKKVIIVDFIQETSTTMEKAVETLEAMNPESIEKCAVMRKGGGEVDFLGMDVDNREWLGGKGPDGYKQYLRHLPYVAVLENIPENTPVSS